MKVNRGGVLGLLAGVAIGLFISLPIDTQNPESAGRAGKIIALTVVGGAFIGNALWEQLVTKNSPK